MVRILFDLIIHTTYKLYNNNEELEVFTDFQEFLQKIEFSLSNLGLQDIIFSYSPETV